MGAPWKVKSVQELGKAEWLNIMDLRDCRFHALEEDASLIWFFVEHHDAATSFPYCNRPILDFVVMELVYKLAFQIQYTPEF